MICTAMGGRCAGGRDVGPYSWAARNTTKNGDRVRLSMTPHPNVLWRDWPSVTGRMPGVGGSVLLLMPEVPVVAAGVCVGRSPEGGG